MKVTPLEKIDTDINMLRAQISDTQAKADERINKLNEKIEKLHAQKDAYWLNLLKQERLDNLKPEQVMATLRELNAQTRTA